MYILAHHSLTATRCFGNLITICHLVPAPTRNIDHVLLAIIKYCSSIISDKGFKIIYFL